jgi:hypothetical protein
MLLRRIREHATSHNWFAVSVDLLIVVLGVFLGMQVNNWNEARIAHDRGRIYRDRIVADLRFNQLDMDRRTAYYTQVRRFGEETLSVLDGSASEVSGEQFLIDAYQATQISRCSRNPTRSRPICKRILICLCGPARSLAPWIGPRASSGRMAPKPPPPRAARALWPR